MFAWILFFVCALLARNSWEFIFSPFGGRVYSRHEMRCLHIHSVTHQERSERGRVITSVVGVWLLLPPTFLLSALDLLCSENFIWLWSLNQWKQWMQANTSERQSTIWIEIFLFVAGIPRRLLKISRTFLFCLYALWSEQIFPSYHVETWKQTCRIIRK